MQGKHLIPIPKQWPESNIYLVEIAEKKVCISRIEGMYYAYTDKCPHAGVSFSDGGVLINKCVVVCPLHAYKFNIKNGRNITDEGYRLRTYVVNPYDEIHLEIFLY
ncbi:MAG: (2Fe-2S)-binding protein [Pseudopedobacter saltans]|uniref:(2Fe-2S)-binding protein n=1 Tax=Pseudopedobacter saltans TaxID=151895 RepID=A0A2W5H3S8_9SPHI|nr:MAG: (2Fe-2S)-binding protein [Pseudopedobacter saltans]